ncbi:MAG: hypothetical protein H6707_09215 [Deltaproteobacteria bacterium]|nr:hypothetical protein [Deltaproteobacteria bacterium]
MLTSFGTLAFGEIANAQTDSAVLLAKLKVLHGLDQRAVPLLSDWVAGVVNAPLLGQ